MNILSRYRRSSVWGIFWYLRSANLCVKRERGIRKKGAGMHTIEFYEDANGKSDLSDYIHMLHAEHADGFYKAAAFLDYLAENGPAGDKVVCRYPEGTIYMHCIPGMKKMTGRRAAARQSSRAGPIPFLKRFRSGKAGSAQKKMVCVILYGRCCEDAGGEDLFVLLHHYFTAGIPRGTPFLQMYRAVRRMQGHCRFVYTRTAAGSRNK